MILQRGGQHQALLAVFVQELGKLQNDLKLAEANAEVALVEKLLARLPEDSGERELVQILARKEPTLEKVATKDTPAKEPEEKVDASLPADLPRTEKALERFLKHTVWDVKTVKGAPNGTFRFRGDGRMSMPWHSVSWRMIDERSVMMYHGGDWQFRLDFSKDLKTVKARGSGGKGKDGWDGVFSKKITSAIESDQLEQIVGSRKWRLNAEEGESHMLEFGPKLIKSETLELPWKKWQVLDGILVISDTKKVVSEFYMETADEPFCLKGLTSKQSKWRLEEMGTGGS